MELIPAYWFLVLIFLGVLGYALFVSFRLWCLQRESRLLSSLLRHSPNPVSIQDRDGRYLYVSKTFAALFDLSAEKMVGRSIRECLPQDIDAELLTYLDALGATAGNEGVGLERMMPACVGTRKLLSTKFPILYRGQAEVFVFLATDITSLSEMETQYWALAEQDLVGVFVLQEQRFVYINECMAGMMGYTYEEALNMSLDEWLPPDEAVRIRAQGQRRIEENIEHLTFEMTLLHRFGSHIPVMVQSRLSNYQGKPAFIGVVLDISEQRASQQHQALASTVFRNSSEGILLTDENANIITVNAAFTRITGYSEADAIGRQSRMFRVDHMGRAVNMQMMQALAQNGSWQGEFLDRRKDGELYPVWLSISCVYDDAQRISHYVCVFSDITQRKYAEDRLHFLATHDTLTRLPNRASFIDRLSQAVDTAREHQGKLAVMFIDLDRFKLINDSFGHPTGDDLLRMIAARLVYAVGEQGYLARLGGDEFTVMLENKCEPDVLEQVARRLLDELAQPLKLENHELFVTGSIGIASFPADGNDAMSLLKNADMAMYHAKEMGKNTFEFFSATMNQQAFERLLLENGLRQALERSEFFLHYQPQIDPFTQQLAGVEALLRWKSADIGFVSPMAFIPVAEDSGMIRAIGDWVMREACQQLKRWDQAGVHVPRVSVNISPRQFEDVHLIDKIIAAIDDAGIMPSRFEAEVTESTLMQDLGETVRVLQALKNAGISVAIDDFGTGYSSLSNLKRFPLDCLKIDRSFVEGLPEDTDNAAITEAIVAISRKLRLQVVAEGVETAEQLRFLKRCGCELIQGYFYSKPLPPEDLADFVKQRDSFEHIFALREREMDATNTALCVSQR